MTPPLIRDTLEALNMEKVETGIFNTPVFRHTALSYVQPFVSPLVGPANEVQVCFPIHLLRLCCASQQQVGLCVP